MCGLVCVCGWVPGWGVLTCTLKYTFKYIVEECATISWFTPTKTVLKSSRVAHQATHAHTHTHTQTRTHTSVRPATHSDGGRR